MPTIARGSLLAAIDLCPALRRDFFIEGQGLSSVERARQLRTFEDVFLLASESVVTMQIVILPKRTRPVIMPPYNDTGTSGLIQATNLALWADGLFIGRT